MANYLVEADATTYLDANKLEREAWTSASTGDRTIALTMATKAIDRLPYKGKKAVVGQANQFPRGADTVVPQDIIDACAELAFEFIDGRDAQIEFDDLTVLSRNLGGVSSTQNANANKEHISVGILSLEAWKLLLPYMLDFRSMLVERTS